MSVADDVRSVLDAKAEALVARRAEDLDALIHSDLVYVNAGGRTFDKIGYIEAYCTSGQVVFTRQRFANLLIKLIDDFAVATLSIDDELKIGERTVSGKYQSLCVFSQSSGRWRWTAGQTMTVRAG